jgi:Fic family protein
MQRDLSGHYVQSIAGGETVRAFVPHALPPNPALNLPGATQRLLEKATVALGRLDSIAELIPHPELFLYLYVRREAVLSSQIEGTQSSLSDLILHEIADVPGALVDDTREVSNYIDALQFGVEQLRNQFPLSNRLLRDMHRVLMKSGRGAEKAPGEFRRSQNWIGGTRPGNAQFVPAPPTEVVALMSDLEKFLHATDDGIPTLIRAALAHVQFETIHPFLDGNGRLGRLLIILLLQHDGLLQRPLLYLSLYFKQHRSVYYEQLNRVRFSGDWEAWIAFFLEGVLHTATDAVKNAQLLLRLLEQDSARVQGLGTQALNLFAQLKMRPITTIKHFAQHAEISVPTASSAIKSLVNLGLLKETTGKARDRVFVYQAYLALFDDGPNR